MALAQSSTVVCVQRVVVAAVDGALGAAPNMLMMASMEEPEGASTVVEVVIV